MNLPEARKELKARLSWFKLCATLSLFTALWTFSEALEPGTQLGWAIAAGASTIATINFTISAARASAAILLSQAAESIEKRRQS